MAETGSPLRRRCGRKNRNRVSAQDSSAQAKQAEMRSPEYQGWSQLEGSAPGRDNLAHDIQPLAAAELDASDLQVAAERFRLLIEKIDVGGRTSRAPNPIDDGRRSILD
jgi:hypothetical protein